MITEIIYRDVNNKIRQVIRTREDDHEVTAEEVEQIADEANQAYADMQEQDYDD